MIDRHRLTQANEYWSNAQRAAAEAEWGKASELTWGFAVQLLKRASVVLLRFRATSHKDLFTAARRLSEFTGDAAYLRTFGQLSALHENFYDAQLDGEVVLAYMADAWRLARRLEVLIARGLAPPGS